MRLAIITHKVIRGEGQARVNYEIARRAVDCGYDVTLLTSIVAPELIDHPRVTWVNIPWSTRFTSLGGEFTYALQVEKWLRKQRKNIDVLQCNGFTLAKSDVNAAHFVHGAWRKSPVHISKVTGGVYGKYQWLYSAVNAQLEKWSFRRARKIVAVSERVKGELIGVGMPSSRIQAIINGVDLKEFAPGIEDRVQLGLPESVPLGLFVGDIRTPRKNLDTVLKALIQAPQLHLAVVGSTDRSPFPDMANQLGLGDRVRFLGYRKDVPALMRASDFFVFPSRYEACSLVLLEALSSGMPIITARTSGGAEVVTSDCGVVLDDPDNVAALATALNALADQPEQRAKMSIAARSVAERHSWQHMADEYLDCYRDVMARAR